MARLEYIQLEKGGIEHGMKLTSDTDMGTFFYKSMDLVITL